MDIPNFYDMSDEELMKDWAPGLTFLGGSDDYAKMQERLGRDPASLEWILVSDAFMREIDRRAPKWLMHIDPDQKPEMGFFDCYEEIDAYWWVDQQGLQISPQFYSVVIEMEAAEACIRWGVNNGMFKKHGAHIAMHLGRGEMRFNMDKAKNIANEYLLNINSEERF